MGASSAMRRSTVAGERIGPPGPRDYMLARIRWSNVLVALAALLIAVVVIVWPALGPPPPDLPPGPPRTTPAPAPRAAEAPAPPAHARHAPAHRPAHAHNRPDRAKRKH